MAIGVTFSRGPGPPWGGRRGYRRRAVASSVPRPVPVVPPEQFKLREYQLECIQSVVTAFEKGHKRVGVSLATGGGKTVGTPI